MGRLWHSGLETNSTTTGVEWTATSGAGTVFTISTSNVRSGTYSAKFLANNSSVGQARYNFAASDQTAGFYFRAPLYIATGLSAATNYFIIRNNANSDKVGIRLNTDNTLTLRNIEDSASVGSNSFALSTGRYYNVELFVDTTTISSTTVTARIDGLIFATGTINLASGIASLVTGMSTIFATGEFYVDDVAVNDTSGSYQNSWCGNDKIICLRPNAAGDSNGFLVQVGGTAGAANNYTRVNEVTPDDATSYNGSAVLSSEDLFNCGDSGIGANDTVNVVAINVRMADLVAADATAAFKVEVEKTTAGTKAQSGTLIPNSTTWLTNAAAAPRNFPLVLYNDPDGNPWTQTTLDSMQIGYIQTAVNVQTISISNICAMVAYTPSVPSIAGNFLELM